MKKFQFALMCAAALAFVACNQNEPDNGGNGGNGGEEPEEPEFVSKISVTDNTLDDWNTLPAEYVSEAVCAENANMNGLLSVKVYNDAMYLNVLLEYNDTVIKDKSWVPVHMYINADNNVKTGGYSDHFTVGCCEVLLETSIFSGGEAMSYNPAVFKWWGAANGGIEDQSADAKGWYWKDASVSHDQNDGYGALVAEGASPIGKSQMIGNKVEIQLLRELITMPFANEFEIGFDIQQNWNAVGFLPNADADEVGNEVKAALLKVTTDPHK